MNRAVALSAALTLALLAACGDSSDRPMTDAGGADTTLGDARRDPPDAADAARDRPDARSDPADTGPETMDADPDPVDLGPDPSDADPIDGAADASLDASGSPMALDVRCPSTIVPASAAPMACRAILVFDDGGVPRELDVTADAETTWSLGECTGSSVCGTADAPLLGASGADAGVFTAPGRTCATTVESNLLQDVLVRWQRDDVTLNASLLITTEPLMGTGFEMDPPNATVPMLADPACATGGGTAGLVVRYRLFRTFVGGGRCPVPMDEVRVRPAIGGPALARSTGVTADGAVDVEVTAVEGWRTPRRHDVVAVIDSLEILVTSLVVVPLIEAAVSVDPSSATTDVTRRMFLDLGGGVSFEITHLADPANLDAPTLVTPDPSARPAMTWNCSGASGAASFSQLWPWTEAGCPRAAGGDLDGPYACTSAITFPVDTADIQLGGVGTFSVVPGSGVPGSHTMELAFPYVGAPDVLRASFGVGVAAVAAP